MRMPWPKAFQSSVTFQKAEVLMYDFLAKCGINSLGFLMSYLLQEAIAFSLGIRVQDN